MKLSLSESENCALFPQWHADRWTMDEMGGTRRLRILSGNFPCDFPSWSPDETVGVELRQIPWIYWTCSCFWNFIRIVRFRVLFYCPFLRRNSNGGWIFMRDKIRKLIYVCTCYATLCWHIEMITFPFIVSIGPRFFLHISSCPSVAGWNLCPCSFPRFYLQGPSVLSVSFYIPTFFSFPLRAFLLEGVTNLCPCASFPLPCICSTAAAFDSLIEHHVCVSSVSRPFEDRMARLQ